MVSILFFLYFFRTIIWWFGGRALVSIHVRNPAVIWFGLLVTMSVSLRIRCVFPWPQRVSWAIRHDRHLRMLHLHPFYLMLLLPGKYTTRCFNPAVLAESIDIMILKINSTRFISFIWIAMHFILYFFILWVHVEVIEAQFSILVFLAILSFTFLNVLQRHLIK